MAVRRWHVAVLNAALIVAVAYLAGRTTTAVLTAAWSARDAARDPAGHSARPASASAAAPGRTAYDVVVARDLFRTGAPHGDATNHLRLVGVAAHAPSRFAVIEDVRRGQQRLYRLGDRIDGGETRPLTIARIETDRVVLESSGGAYVLARAERAAGKDGRAPEPEPARAAGEHALVRRGRDDEYLLDRRAFEATVGNFDRVASQIRVIPNVVEGKAVGYRVFGIPTSSIFSDLGLRNGDVLSSVNAVALTDPATALGVLRDLPRERRITLDIDRQRRPQTITYEIR